MDATVKLVTFGEGRAASGFSTARRSQSRRGDDARVLRARRRRRDGRARALAETRLRAPIVPKKFFHTAGNFREHEEESKQRRLVARDRTLDRLLPERRRARRARRARGLPGAPDGRARLRAGARRRAAQGGEVVPARGGRRLHRRLRDLQRHHGTGHPAARDALGRLLVLQGDRHVLPAGAVDRDTGRDPRSARPRDGAAGQRRDETDLAFREDVRHHF